MYSTTVIVFREVLEAALVVGIVLAAARGVKGRNAAVAGGLIAGLVGAATVAFSVGYLAEALNGLGQEVFNATVLLVAVGMLAWHNIWMASHSRRMTANLKSMGNAVVAGNKPIYLLAIVVGLAVTREGAEVVLFLYGLAASNAGAGMLTGGLAGLALGSGFGGVLYFGLLRIPLRYLFTVTSGLILLLAAGMASQAAAYLMQAGYLPNREPLWNSSGFLSPDSLAGQLLHALAGYEARPTSPQLLFYTGTFLLILLGMKTRRRTPAQAVALRR